MELRKEYKEELIALQEKMLDAQELAKKFPAFSEQIYRNKFTLGFTGNISNNYKGLYFAWGINRYHYSDRNNITNYRGDFHPQYLWDVYINQYSLFDTYVDTGLHDIHNSIDVFFYDHLNTSFYATDEQIIPLLDALVNWYEKAKVINDEWRKENKKRELLEQLEKLA